MNPYIFRSFCEIRPTKFSFHFLLLCLSVIVNADAQEFWQKTNGPYGGFVHAFAISSSGKIFVGTGGGGAFRSTNNGKNWSAINTGFPSDINIGLSSEYRNVRAFAINSVGHIFAGLDGGGIFRSTNDGTNWSPANNGLSSKHIRALSINSSGHLFAGTKSGGMFRSTDNGANWKEINLGLTEHEITTLCVSPAGPIWAGTLKGVFRSIDNGENWMHIATSFDSISAIAIDSGGYIFIGTNNRGIFRSINNGEQWKQVNTGLSNLNVKAFGFNSAGHIFAGTDGDGVFRSIDNGENWINVSYSKKDFRVLSLVIISNENILAGTRDSGVFQTTDGGITWKESNAGLSAFPITRFSFNSQGHVFVATGGAGIFRSSDNGENWKQINNGLTNLFVTSLARNNSGGIFAGTAIGVFRSTDNGESWTYVTADRGSIIVSSLVIALDGRIFVGTTGDTDNPGRGVLVSTDNGDTWAEKNQGLSTLNQAVSCLAINSFGDTFVGSSFPGVYRLKNNANSWTLVGIGQLFPIIITLFINSHGHVFAGTWGAGIFLSTDNGDNWTSINNGLNNWGVISSAIGPRDDIFVGTFGGGVLHSANNGENWTELSSGLPMPGHFRIVTGLAIDSNGQMFAGTAYGEVFRSAFLIHTPPSTQQSGQPVLIQTRINEIILDLSDITLNYRRGGDSIFSALSMAKKDTLYIGTIPSSEVTSRGIEYYFIAKTKDAQNRQPASGFFSIQIKVPNESKTTTQPSGNAQTAYRLISVPLDLANKDARAVLEDDLGQYNIDKWRFYELQADQSYVELPNTSVMTPGKAFWLMVREAGKIINTGPGTTNLTTQNYAVHLHPRWNLVANPFNFPIPVIKTTLKNTGKIPTLFSFQGEWRILGENAKMQPFEGYAVFNDSPSVDSLIIDPALYLPAYSLPKKVMLEDDQNVLWAIRILAKCQDASDVENVAAIAPNATNTWDELDQPEPPVIGEYVSVYFLHPELGKLSKIYCTDFRPESSEGYVWPFAVKTNIRDKVNLTFKGIDNVPSDLEVWLADEALKITLNLRESNYYNFAGFEYPKQLKLVVGKHDFVSKNLTGAQDLPTIYELSPNFPNPFNAVTTIRFGLPKSEAVTLRIYNILGREIATLADNEPFDVGYHTKVWNGKTTAGESVATGVYFIRMHAGNFVKMRKMLLLK